MHRIVENETGYEIRVSVAFISLKVFACVRCEVNNFREDLSHTIVVHAENPKSY